MFAFFQRSSNFGRRFTTTAATSNLVQNDLFKHKLWRFTPALMRMINVYNNNDDFLHLRLVNPVPRISPEDYILDDAIYKHAISHVFKNENPDAIALNIMNHLNEYIDELVKTYKNDGPFNINRDCETQLLYALTPKLSKQARQSIADWAASMLDYKNNVVGGECALLLCQLLARLTEYGILPSLQKNRYPMLMVGLEPWTLTENLEVLQELSRKNFNKPIFITVKGEQFYLYGLRKEGWELTQLDAEPIMNDRYIYKTLGNQTIGAKDSYIVSLHAGEIPPEIMTEIEKKAAHISSSEDVFYSYLLECITDAIKDQTVKDARVEKELALTALGKMGKHLPNKYRKFCTDLALEPLAKKTTDDNQTKIQLAALHALCSIIPAIESVDECKEIHDILKIQLQEDSNQKNYIILETLDELIQKRINFLETGEEEQAVQSPRFCR